MPKLTTRERRIIETALQAFCLGLALNEVDNGYVADGGASPETITEDLREFFRLLGVRLGREAREHARAWYGAMVNDLARELTDERSPAPSPEAEGSEKPPLAEAWQLTLYSPHEVRFVAVALDVARLNLSETTADLIDYVMVCRLARRTLRDAFRALDDGARAVYRRAEVLAWAVYDEEEEGGRS